jgi:hypothetical protein
VADHDGVVDVESGEDRRQVVGDGTQGDPA